MSPKQYLVFRYLELLLEMMKVDTARSQKPRHASSTQSRPQVLLLQKDLARPGLSKYLMDIFYASKNNYVLKKQVLSFFLVSIQHGIIRDYQVVDQISQLIVDEVSATKMVFNQFTEASLVMVSLRILVVLS